MKVITLIKQYNGFHIFQYHDSTLEMIQIVSNIAYCLQQSEIEFAQITVTDHEDPNYPKLIVTYLSKQ